MTKVLLLIFLLSPVLLASGIGEKERIHKLIIQYEKCDASDCAEISYKLLKTFILADSLFLEAFKDNGKIFTRWADELQYEVFTNYYGGDSVDVVLETEKLNTLYGLTKDQVNKAKRLMRYATEVSKLKAVIENITIRQIE